MDVKSTGERLLYYFLVVVSVIGVCWVIVEYTGVFSGFFSDPILGDWEHDVNQIAGIGYRFYGNGTYEIRFVDVENNTWDNIVFASGTWEKVGDGFYKIYDENGKIYGYMIMDNGWLYSGKYAFKKIK